MERDHHVELTDGGKYNFNSHAHVERDYMTMPKFTTIRHFNSHAHVERDEAQSQVTAQYKNFNSHAHVERDSITRLSQMMCSFQLTRSRGA